MKIKDVIALALETLMVSRFRSFLSVLGVTIGVAAVIAGVILGVGNRDLIMQKLAAGGADRLWFYVKPEAKGSSLVENLSYKPNLSITKEDVDYIKKQCRAIRDITPFFNLPATLRYHGKHHTIKALGFMSPRSFENIFRVKTVRGRFLSSLDVEAKAKVCVIEETGFSKEIFGGKIPLGEYILIGRNKYKIIGTVRRLTFSFGYPERLIALFPSTSLQETIGTRNYTLVWLTVKNIVDVPKVRLQLKQALSQRFGYPSKLYISEYSHHVQTALEILNLLTFIIIGIATISLTVGGVGIMNVMMTMVAEQTRNIGIAKAIGAKRGTVLLLFIAESTILTVMGGIVGILIGLGISKLVTSALSIPFAVPAWVIPLGFFLSVSIGVISGSYPAKRAAGLNPVDALRQI
jgi:putative ABC transport system permease protein